jgi:hypothetical protein
MELSDCLEACVTLRSENSVLLFFDVVHVYRVFARPVDLSLVASPRRLLVGARGTPPHKAAPVGRMLQCATQEITTLSRGHRTFTKGGHCRAVRLVWRSFP